MRKKAYIINGGAGRVICSIPAFEMLNETDKDFIIVCEGGSDIYFGHPTLGSRVYDFRHKNLFEAHLKDRDIITPEPYRVWEYYNQKCNISQAFDIEINKKGIRKLPSPTINLNKMEIANAYKIIQEVKARTGFTKTIVIQPFGRSIQQNYDMLVDPTSRSIAQNDLIDIIEKLKKSYGIILMSEFTVDLGEELNPIVAQPRLPNLRLWAGIIELSTHFVGCDSVGQHIAKALDKTATVILGSTFPINVSYPEDSNFDIIDIGKDIRQYSPIRISLEEEIDRANDRCMDITPHHLDNIVRSVQKRAGKSTTLKIDNKSVIHNESNANSLPFNSIHKVNHIHT